MTHRNNNFNLLRLLAACQVVMMHANGHLKVHIPGLLFDAIMQFPGVAVFFVISGFLVSESCLTSTTGEFFLKRALRIYPGLIANILVLEALMHITGGVTIASRATYLLVYLQVYFLTASDWLASQFSAVRYAPAFFPGYPSGVLWTLTVELTFYLILPAILAAARVSRSLCAALVAIEAIASYVLVRNADGAFYNAYALFSITVPPCFWLFAIGILARLYWQEIRHFFESRFAYWIVAYAALAVAAAIVYPDRIWLNYRWTVPLIDVVRVAVMGGVILAAAYSATTLTARLRLDRIDLSYGIYLYHMLAISTLVALGYQSSNVLLIPVYAASFIMAYLSWVLVEKPALRLRARMRTRGKGEFVRSSYRDGSPKVEAPINPHFNSRDV